MPIHSNCLPIYDVTQFFAGIPIWFKGWHDVKCASAQNMPFTTTIDVETLQFRLIQLTLCRHWWSRNEVMRVAAVDQQNLSSLKMYHMCFLNVYDATFRGAGGDMCMQCAIYLSFTINV